MPELATIKRKRKRGVEKEIKTKTSKPNTEDEEPKNIEKQNPKSNDFDVKVFRKQINMKPAQLVSLNQFLEVCSKSTSTDYMTLYLECGGNANEVLQILDYQNKKNPAISTPVLSILRLIFLKIQSSLPKLFQAAEETCRYFLNSYVSTIDYMLSEKSSSKQQKVTLKLLTVIVGLGPELGFTVLNQLSLQPRSLSHLVKNKDVRDSFVDFAMSFLVDDNSSLIKSALGKQGFITLIVPGLVRDNSNTVLMVLETFSKNIVNNLNISKTIKIKIFNSNIVLSIFNLFNWTDHISKTEEEKLNTKKCIEDAAYNLLLVLCTSHKHGIYFTDKSLGTGDIPTNQTLWKAIESLEAPWNNEKAGSLIVEMVCKCPDLYRPVIRLVEQSFEPRNSEKWLKTTNFFVKLLKSLSAKQILSSMANMSAIQISNFIRTVYLPIPILKISLNALNTPDDGIRNQIILLLHTMLYSVKSYISLLVSEKNSAIGVLKIKLEDFIPKHFPSTDIMMNVVHSMLDNNSLSVDIDIEESKDNFKIPLPNQSRLLINVLDLLLLYNDVLPNSFDPIAAMLDSKRLFDKMEYIGEVDKGELKLKITMFLLSADKFAFSPNRPLFKDILQSIFEVFISSDTSISEHARGVLYNILETTGIFDKSLNEIDLLLSITYNTGLKYDESIAKNIVDVIVNINNNNNKFLSEIPTQNEKEDEEYIKSYFDAFLKNVKNQDHKTINENIVFEKSFLTPFIIGLLEHLKCDKSKQFKSFANDFIIHLLHSQDCIENIFQILDKYKITPSVKNYVTAWKSEPIIIDTKLIEESSVYFKLNSALLSDDSINLDTTFAPKNTAKFKTSNIHSQGHNIICLSSNESELFSWFNMILFYVTQQGSLGTLNDCKLLNGTQALHHVLLMAKSNEMSSKVMRLMVGTCLTHQILLKNFLPFKKHKNSSVKFLFDFVLGFVKFCYDNEIEKALVDSLLTPYRHKIFVSLLAQLEKASNSKKGQALPDIIYILSTVNLNLYQANLLLKKILKIDVNCMVSEENDASSWVFVICHIVNQFTEHSKLFSLEILRGIALLYSKIITELDLVINMTDFEESLYNYLISNPETVLSIPSATFKAIFSVKHVSKFTSRIGSLLLKLNMNFLPMFCKDVIEQGIIEKRELVLPLTTAAFCHKNFSSHGDTIKKIYDHYKSNIQKVIEKPHKASQIYVDNISLIIKLINICMDKLECENYFKKVHKFDSVEIFHLDILEAIFLKGQNYELNDVHLNNYILCILQLANMALKREIPQHGKLNKLYSCFKQILLVCTSKDPSTFAPVKSNAIWQNFFKSILKYYLQTDSKETESDECDSNESALFGVVSCLINLIYPNEDDDVVNLFEMTSSHSEFLNILLSNRHKEIKTHLVKLLFVMVLKNKTTMKSAHITVYLSSYHGSLNMSDQYLLALLKYYERNEQSMTEYQPYLWGDTATSHYAVRSKRTKSSLWSNPTANHILNLLDKEMIEKTIQHFPTHKILDIEEDLLNSTDFLLGTSKMESVAFVENIIENSLKNKRVKSLITTQDTYTSLTEKTKLKEYQVAFRDLVKTEDSFQLSHEVSDSEIYDPAFLMPLLNFVVTPGSAVSCHLIVRGGFLSIPLVALSSSCPFTRVIALNILQRFYSLLESEMYYRNDKILWSQFIDTLKSSMDSAQSVNFEQRVNGMVVPRLSRVSAMYLARSAIIMTNPLDPLFKPVNNFVICKQYINFSIVPDLLDLFHDRSIHYLERRSWILTVIRDGIKTLSDVKVLFQSVVFKMILPFYSTCFCDVRQKLLILEILNSSICIPKAAKILVDGHGLFPWLSCSFRELNADNKTLLSMGITIVSNLWMSLACEPLCGLTTLINMEFQENIIDNINHKCFTISENHQVFIVCLLIDLVNKLTGVSAFDLRTFLNVMRKISKSSINKISKKEMLTLLIQCNHFVKKPKIINNLLSVVKNSKPLLLYSSYSVLDNVNYASEDEKLIVLYLHEIIMVWVS